jgi:glucan phosphorylase
MLLQGLREHADDPALQQAWRTVKQQAKQRAAAKIQALTGVKVSPNALFDIQVRQSGVWLYVWKMMWLTLPVEVVTSC